MIVGYLIGLLTSTTIVVFMTYLGIYFGLDVAKPVLYTCLGIYIGVVCIFIYECILKSWGIL